MDCIAPTLCKVATPNQILLEAYTAAELAILSGQSYRFGERQLQRADLQFVQKERARLQALVDREAGNRGRFKQADFSGGQGGIEGAEWNRC